MGGISKSFSIGNSTCFSLTVCLDCNPANHKGLFVCNILDLSRMDVYKQNSRLYGTHTLVFTSDEEKGVYFLSAPTLEKLRQKICTTICNMSLEETSLVFRATESELKVLNNDRGFPDTDNWKKQVHCNDREGKGDKSSNIKSEVTEWISCKLFQSLGLSCQRHVVDAGADLFVTLLDTSVVDIEIKYS
jgi:hypothetical protein